MDSQDMTKIIEAAKLETVENANESVKQSTPALDNISKLGVADKANKKYEETKMEDTEIVKKVEAEEIEDSDKSDNEDTKTITTIAVSKMENYDENLDPEIETKTTTVFVTNNSDENPKTETNTTTTVVVGKKEKDDETEKSPKPVSITSQVGGSPVDADENTNLDEEKKTVVPSDGTTESHSKTKVFIEQNVSTSEEDMEESEESDNQSEDEGQSEEKVEENTENKTEKIEDVKTEDVKTEDVKTEESKPNPSQSSAIEKNEINTEEKVSDTNNDINNQIENIISDIDINIKAQEKITQLKEQELQLIQKQKELASQIHQQQILAEKLIAENQFKEQELKLQKQIHPIQKLDYQNRNQFIEEFTPNVSDAYNQQQDDFYNVKESSNLSRTVDLRKIFTPATDAPQILPRNRKLYASSAFYSPTLHPTVEDQVELARRISHSLSDISNQKSKGQTMYVNRKKRSVKWVHEGSGQGKDGIIETNSLCKENTETNTNQELTKLEKMPLKLIMNPRGQMRDYNSLKDSINIETGLLSPDNCAELITALQLHKGRGAELFAKRRRKADNWVVDETNAGTHSPSGIPDYQQYQARPATSPNILPAYSDAGKHRVQLNIHQDQLIEKYSKPGVQVVKSPWEAALQTGSASSAFLQDTKFGNQTSQPITINASPVHFNSDANDFPGSVKTTPRSPTAYGTPTNNFTHDSYKNSFDTRFQNQPIQSSNPQRDLAYKPSVAQGWGGRNVVLPTEYYHQEHENYNTDDLTSYCQCTNENNIVVHQKSFQEKNLQEHLTTNYLLKNQALLNFNNQIQERLQKLEYFQKRLALDLGLGIELGLNSNQNTVAFSQENISSESQIFSININEKKSTNVIRDNCESVALKRITPENNESINVQELILSFENQAIRDHQENNNYKPIITNDEGMVKNDFKTVNYSVLESSMNEIEKTSSTMHTKGLYVPKEISLASYAPPPTQSSDQQTTQNYKGQPTFDFGKQYSPGNGSEVPYSTFPVTNDMSGFYSSSQKPKQQLQTPQSYQKVETNSIQAAPYVNFNPSPLPFEKLSKFQDFSQKNSGISSQRYLNQPPEHMGYKNKMRNVAPLQFGSAEVEDRSIFKNLQRSQIPTTSNKFDGYRQSTQSTVGSGQSFNNCARGWNNDPGKKFCSRGQVVVPSKCLPYSDF